MTTAEKLRMELVQDVPFTKEQFIKHICKLIKSCGCAKFVCDRHIGRTELEHGGACKLAHEDVLKEWAYSEGFNVSYKHNGYGVRYILFHL